MRTAREAYAIARRLPFLARSNHTIPKIESVSKSLIVNDLDEAIRFVATKGEFSIRLGDNNIFWAFPQIQLYYTELGYVVSSKTKTISWSESIWA